MTELIPSGWVETTLGEICHIRSGNSTLIKGRMFLEPAPDRVPAFSASGQDIWCQGAEHHGPGIVISAVGARCGKAFLASGSWTAIANTQVARAKGDIDIEFLWYLLNDEDFWVKGGSAQPFVKVRPSLELTVLLPPLTEQKRIVTAIEDHFSRIEATESAAQTALVRLESLRRAILTAAFSGRLVDQNFDDEPASILLKRITTDQPKHRNRTAARPEDTSSMTDPLPPGWAWSYFGVIAQTQLGKMLSSKSKTGIGSQPYLRNQNVQWHKFDLSDVAKMDFTDEEKVKYELRTGDLLVCEGGEVGRCAIWTLPTGVMYFQKALHRVRPRHSIQVKWLEYFLRWASEADLFAKHTSGSTINHLPQRDLRQLQIPISPTSEQIRIVNAIEEHFSRIDAAKASLERCLQRCAVLRRSILAAAFSGRLVPQDPDDEPASVLLERIATERSKRDAGPQRRPRRKSA